MSKNLSLGASLLARRRALGLTQCEAAGLAGVSRPTVAGLERDQGQRRSLNAVAGALGLRLVGADRLTEARERRGWSIPVAAARAGLTAPTVRLLEAGGGRVESLLVLAHAVGAKLRLEAAGRNGGQDEWYTPSDLLTVIMSALGVTEWTMDPCSPGLGVSPVRAARHVTAAQDSLSLLSWGAPDDALFVNPPFSRLPAFAGRCAAEAARCLRIVLLVPASRPGARWWRDHVAGGGGDVIYLGRRLRFTSPNGEGDAVAPFDTALVCWGWPGGAVERLAAALPDSLLVPADGWRRAA